MSNLNEMMDEEIVVVMEVFDLLQLELFLMLQVVMVIDGMFVLLVLVELLYFVSLMLDVLDESCCFKVKIVCECCFNLVWFVLLVELKCYCCVMFLVMWSSKELNQFMYCDGEFLGQEEG